ncbi:MAG: hypothetical protein WBA36_14555 [Mesorhizobium sp.]
MVDLNPIFIRAARSLYGEQWQSPISRDLDLSDRQVRRIVSGEANARPGMLINLWRLMLERQLEMDKIIDEIKFHGATQDLPDRPDA